MIALQACDVELTAPVVRPGIPALIGAWPQSRFWLLCVDLYPALAAASLPWSTTAVSVFHGAVDARRSPRSAGRRFSSRYAHQPAFCRLPFSHWRWPACSRPRTAGRSGIQGLVPVSKLLAVPILLYHYERSQRGHWVLFTFLAACVLFMGLSWVTYFADWKPSPGGMAGVPVRNYIDQSHEFALCLFVMAPLILSFAANGHRAWTFAFAAVMLGFYFDMRYVATSRTAYVYFPVLLILFAVKYLNRRRAIYLLIFAAVVEFAVLFTSPYMRDRVGRTVEDYKVDRDTSAAASNGPTGTATSNGLRLAYWRLSHQVDFRGAGLRPRHRIDEAALRAAKPQARAANGRTPFAILITRRCMSQSNGASSVASCSTRCGTSILQLFFGSQLCGLDRPDRRGAELRQFAGQFASVRLSRRMDIRAGRRCRRRHGRTPRGGAPVRFRASPE